MAVITTLVDDIYNLLTGKKKKPTEELLVLCTQFGDRVTELMMSRLTTTREPGLSMSNFGKPCERQLWYSINTPEDAEPMQGHTLLKFLYGDLTEELVLFLTEAAGHTVEGRQTKLQHEGLPGSRDAVIDGHLVDVKSASTFGFKKFKSGELTPDDDMFGYLPQLDLYLEGSQDDDLVKDKDQASFLAFDKTLGHLCVNTHPSQEVNYETTIPRKRAMLAVDTPPERGFSDTGMGAAGNRKLGVACSYCAFKKTCWPGLRTFLYASGPVHLTRVVRVPDVPEAA